MERRLGAPVRVVGRAALAGGYASGGVERIDLDAGERAVAVVLKRASPVEIAAMRALAVVRAVERPALLAAGPGWLVVPFYAGEPLAEGPDVPAALWHTLAAVHAHWYRRRPRGLPVVDAGWWRHLCRERIRPHVVAALDRTGDRVFADAARRLDAWADDAAAAGALAVLPRTLVHGDAHRGNVLLTADGPTLIDWGNARVAPPGQDLAVLRAQGATDLTPYRERFAQLTGGMSAPGLLELEDRWADLYAHVGYLGFAADHLGAARVAELVDGAAAAHAALGPALTRLVSAEPC